MSHFSRIKTKLVERVYLLAALKDLGYQVEEGDLKVGGFAGASQKVNIKVKLNLSYDIGFRETPTGYELVADWWGVRGLEKDVFLDKLSQRYAYHATRSRLEEQGFTLVEETTEKNGEVRLVLRKLA
ncbi:DUF1257 domain-containing protein [Levilinea saccharolytica]|uniref:DUF1257 domain-containing protein n=1 Tax=Levilinea saccharolytica TaxID=229921 RepID=A0A0P6YPZ8_9CHLR|nr:DUF1257 domain-containing protein [Levilinea saccharolytica]KPL85077.1 hypothetical protein ADN01_06800 [Levilinea saccharolytica]GAP18183.1 hypothetical protein LSAC_02068 [Levilinea saccharolytica]